MLPPSRLFDHAEFVLNDVIAAHYLAQGVPLPMRRYVAPGLPAADCEQITIHVETTYTEEGAVDQQFNQPVRRQVAHKLQAATFVASIFRCTPVFDDAGDPPDPLDMEQSAFEVLSDAIVVPNALLEADDAGRLGDNLIALLGWQTIEPQGGFAGGLYRFTMGLLRFPTGS